MARLYRFAKILYVPANIHRQQFLLAATAATTLPAAETDFDQRRKGLLYSSSMHSPASVQGWKMEGPGEISFSGGWMTMRSPGEKMHHVYWCPQKFPANFAAEWELQNLHPEAGLCIVFFCAAGLAGQDIMDPCLPPRDGTFRQYNRGQMTNYHISYYANTPNVPARPIARLRKNPGANIVHEGPAGIPAGSTEIHHVQLLKRSAHIQLWVDNRPIIDWTDRAAILGPAYGAGKIALRQMQWSQFRYRNFRVWGL